MSQPRGLAAALVLLAPSVAAAQPVVVSPSADQIGVTIYRDPNGSGAMNLGWLGGFALVTETRRVSLPAGASELRFEGVAGGLVPQSAVVDGLGEGVVEKNRDAKLLSPGTLLASSLGRRVHLRRTSRATGKVVEQEAVIRAGENGVVIETDQGAEALRCTGLNETLLPEGMPAGLSAKPTLSVRVRADRPIEAAVRLSYLTTGFDWRAHYVATLAPDGRTLSLFAWLTLANGDETGFRDARTMAVAGRLNWEGVERLQPEIRPISLNCWPQQRTHQTPDVSGEIVVGRRLPGPPPPPPPPSPERGGDGESIVVTGSSIMAQREALGDLKLYRIPIPVTVASNSQKQVALLAQPRAKVQTRYRFRTYFANETGEPVSANRILRMENRKDSGLGLPLPAGSFTLYTERAGQLFLLGEGRMTDRAEGEQVDVELAQAPGVRVAQRLVRRDPNDDGEWETEVTAINDLPHAVRFEVQFNDSDEDKKLRSTPKLVRRDGAWWWDVTLPANGSRTLRINYGEID